MSQNPIATFKTTLGEFKVELYKDKAPKTVANFVGLATGTQEYTDPKSKEKKTGKFYNGTIFHRIIADFMIQGGDPTGTGYGGPGYQFADEFHPDLRHDGPGILSMANAGPNTNGSQFFITHTATPHLDKRHAIFGKVIEGYEIVDQIARVKVDYHDKPEENVVIEDLTVEG